MLFTASSAQDPDNSELEIADVDQGGLGLPDRDYYFDTDDRAKMLRQEYVAHVGRMFRLLGDDSTPASAHAVRYVSPSHPR